MHEIKVSASPSGHKSTFLNKNYTNIFSGLANNQINAELGGYEAQKAVDDMAVAIGDHKILAYIASHRLARPTSLDEDQPRLKKIRIRAMEPTNSNDNERDGEFINPDTPLVIDESDYRGPLKMTLHSKQTGEFKIIDTAPLFNEYIETDNVKSEEK